MGLPRLSAAFFSAAREAQHFHFTEEETEAPGDGEHAQGSSGASEHPQTLWGSGDARDKLVWRAVRAPRESGE